MRVVEFGSLVMLLAAAAALDGPGSVINEITKNFGSMMLHCVQLLYPDSGYSKDVLDFWNRDLNITGDSYLGCLAACSLFKLQMRNRDGSLNETNITNFLRDSGADEQGAQALLSMFQTCQSQGSSERKACDAGLKTIMCFRSHIFRLNWTPQFYRGPLKIN